VKNGKMRITYYQRRPQDGNFSIERLFADVRRALPDNIDEKIAVSRFPSMGFWGRVYNIVEAAFRQRDVNHVTGDVHYLTLLLRKKKTLLTIPDLVSVHRLKGIRREIFRFFWYWLPIRRAAVVTVISRSTKEELFRHVKVDRQKVRVVHACVSEDFHPAPKEFVSTKPVILQVGTGPNKNLERAAEALADIPCHLRIIGLPNAKQAAVLQKKGVEYSFAANISDEDVIEEYRRCDMLVFASTYEGFGLPIVEAQATGRPVVTSNIGSMPEVGGEAACFIDPFDVESIRGGILKVIHDGLYRDELVRRGFENVERFRSGKIAREYIHIYRELLAR
jgi:glycosyltransferase involved in cell wall biosynthesis